MSEQAQTPTLLRSVPVELRLVEVDNPKGWAVLYVATVDGLEVSAAGRNGLTGGIHSTPERALEAAAYQMGPLGF